MNPSAELEPGTIARVLIDSPVAHLGRLFDYRIPPELDQQAQAGVRVRVPFGHRTVTGYLVERCRDTDSSHTLKRLAAVQGPFQVLTPSLWKLAQTVAHMYAANTADTLKLAIPPRVVRVEREFNVETAGGPGVPPRPSLPSSPARPEIPTNPLASAPTMTPFVGYPRMPAFLEHLAAGQAPRAHLQSLRGYGPQAWHRQLAAIIAACAAAGKGAVVIVPDGRDLDALSRSVSELLGELTFVRLTAEDGPTHRYRSYLQVLHGHERIVLGTRSAAYAPVENLGLLCCWDDGNDSLAERRSPYHHIRELLVLRARLEQVVLLLASYNRTSPVQRLIESGWMHAITAPRDIVRQAQPRIINTHDRVESARDRLATRARLPSRAWQVAHDALMSGPVLVQVARAGYAPALACEQCRQPARCSTCSGPLSRSGPQEQLRCRWCRQSPQVYRCEHCGSSRIRLLVPGAVRTAEELGRAFPAVPVVTSSGERIREQVSERPALIVATPGAEPVAAGGYAAALLLDGNQLLSWPHLNASEDALRRWLQAAALVRPASAGGLVVTTAPPTPATAALVRWDPEGFAHRELQERWELGLPPASWVVSVTGAHSHVERFFTHIVAAHPGLRVLPPAPDPYEAAEYRVLLFVPLQARTEVMEDVRGLRARLSADRTPVRVQADATDVL